MLQRRLRLLFLLGLAFTGAAGLVVLEQGEEVFTKPSGSLEPIETPLALSVAMEPFPRLEPGIYEKLSRWVEVLGEPETVPQPDGGVTLFYWPEHGIAVFTHPLYEGQFRRKAQPERRVTSVILPLRESLHPGFLPVEDDVVLRFDRLIDLQGVPLDVPANSQKTPPDGRGSIDLVASRFRKTVERLHLSDGEPIAVEIRDAWWLSHYD